MRKPSRVVAHRGDDDGPCHTILAATNKCLAQSNKSRTGGEPICYCTVSAPCARVSRNRAHLHSAGTAKVCHEPRSAMTSVTEWLEPISKSFEEDDEAGKLDKAEEIVGVVLPANEDPALPLNPGEEALDEPASHVAA